MLRMFSRKPEKSKYIDRSLKDRSLSEIRRRVESHLLDYPSLPEPYIQVYQQMIGGSRMTTCEEAILKGEFGQAWDSALINGMESLCTHFFHMAEKTYLSAETLAVTVLYNLKEDDNESSEGEENEVKELTKTEKSLEEENKTLRKILEKAENKIGQLEEIRRGLRSEKKRMEAIEAKTDPNQVGKLKEELYSLKQIAENQEKTIEAQNMLIISLREDVRKQNDKISELKKENRCKTRLMEYGFAGDEVQSRQIAFKKLELEKLQKELSSDVIKGENIRYLELFLASNAKQKDKIAAKQYFENRMKEIEATMRKIQENLKKIDKFLSFSIHELLPVSRIDVFDEKTTRSIDQLLRSSRKDGAEGESDECMICLEPIMQSNDTTEIFPHCRTESHATCIGEWLVKGGTCPFCRRFILRATNSNGDGQ